MHEALLGRAGGVVVYRMVDSSPQGGWDWFLHGSRTIPMEELGGAFADAMVLLSAMAADTDKSSAAKRLAALLPFRQGPPTAVGSGRASLRRKAHALCHSVHLESDSWPSAVRLLNSTVTFTGDLGTESLFNTFKGHISDVMGGWVVDNNGSQESSSAEAESIVNSICVFVRLHAITYFSGRPCDNEVCSVVPLATRRLLR